MDLPGYGFSKMSKQEKIVSGKYIEEYLEEGKNIALIILILDIRHKPTEDDLLMYNYILRSNLPFMVLTNKADKIAVTKVDGEVQRIKEILKISYSTILPFSSERKIYQEKVWKEQDIRKLKELYPYDCNTETGRPTNTDFLYGIAKKINRQ